MKRILALLLVPTLLLGADAEKAKKKLAKMDYEPDEKGFVKAADDGEKKAVELFLEAGINVNARGRYGNTPLIEAADGANTEIVAMLLKAGADPNLRNNEGRSALYYAVQGCGGNDPQGKVLDLLLAAPSIDLKTPYKRGATLVHLAVETDSDVQLKKLLAKGLDPNAKNEAGETPLAYASTYGRAKVLAVLSSASGVQQDVRNADGETPLLGAASTGEVAAGMKLLSGGADAKATDKNGETALHKLASLSKHNRVTFKVDDAKSNEFVETLIAKGTPVDAKRKYDGTTALLVAVHQGHVPTVTTLLAKGANPNAANDLGEKPILIAAKNGDAPVVKALLDAKADPNASDRTGRGTLKLAQDYPDVVSMLKAAGAKEGAAGAAKKPTKK